MHDAGRNATQVMSVTAQRSGLPPMNVGSTRTSWLLARGRVGFGGMGPPPAISQLTGRLKLVLAAVAYEASRIVAYVEWVSPAYGYQGFVNRRPSLALVTIACRTPLRCGPSPVIWIQQEIRRPSQMIYWILLLLAYIPSQLMPWFVLTEPLL